MTLKVYMLKGTVTAGSPMTKLDEITCRSGLKWVAQEIRVYTSQASGVTVRLRKNTYFLADISSEAISTYKLPYPANSQFGEGDKIVLEASNEGTADSEVIVEVIVEETKA